MEHCRCQWALSRSVGACLCLSLFVPVSDSVSVNNGDLSLLGAIYLGRPPKSRIFKPPPPLVRLCPDFQNHPPPRTSGILAFFQKNNILHKVNIWCTNTFPQHITWYLLTNVFQVNAPSDNLLEFLTRSKIINFLEAATEFLGEVSNVRDSHLKAFYFVFGYFFLTLAATNKKKEGYLNVTHLNSPYERSKSKWLMK